MQEGVVGKNNNQMKDLIGKMSDALYECAIPKYFELVKLSEKPDVIQIKPVWFLESWLKDREDLVRRLCYDIESTRNHTGLMMNMMVHPQGFLSLSINMPPTENYGQMSPNLNRDIFFSTFDDFINPRVSEKYIEELSDAVLERIHEYESVRNDLINKIEELEKFSFASKREVITEKAPNHQKEKELIAGVFHEEDETTYYFVLDDDFNAIAVSKPGTASMMSNLWMPESL